MVTQKGLEKYRGEKEDIARDANLDPDVVEKVIDVIEQRMVNNRRQPTPPAPEGGITLREASRRHSIPDRTIGRWVKQGIIPVLCETRNEIYIHGELFAKLVNKYKSHTGTQRKSMKQISEQAS